VSRAPATGPAGAVAGTAPAPGPGAGRAPPAGVPAAGEPPALVFRERRDVDREPEFAYPPLGLDELPARLGQAVRATVALWIDAQGTLVAIDVRADPPVGGRPEAVLRAAIAESFAPVSFPPARFDGRQVTVVTRYELHLDPSAPIAPGFGMVN